MTHFFHVILRNIITVTAALIAAAGMMCASASQHLPVFPWLNSPACVFTSLRLMIKLLLKTAQCWHKCHRAARPGLCPVKQRYEPGLFLGGGHAGQGGGHMVRKPVDTVKQFVQRGGLANYRCRFFMGHVTFCMIMLKSQHYMWSSWLLTHNVKSGILSYNMVV